ncbi:Pycsar system effector family protein [Lacinutrix sp. 5H-3-7-4]|uniref:Pycsar system effector family protein n=1 Tax=Lacinutrix sp. (strain 5H-3-7-4) TaxID=983544 RepID=UPI00020A3681|nr:Pycsar system effector family protein [Lacinutrix sp. 5H-3-7-4]AEH01279.1 metal-dependent phosphohydrolase hd sub domain protein [Lacinutrix sp. 5H-3-7-4]
MSNDKNLKASIKNEAMLKDGLEGLETSPERAIQSFYMISLKNHIKLSAIADTKANILLSVNAIIISLVLTNLIAKLGEPNNKHLTIPVIIILMSSLLCVVISILITRPNVTKGKFTQEDIDNNKVNLAFFGNFHSMEYKEYEAAIKDMHNNNNYIYGALTKDLYFLGDVMSLKYKWLRIVYTIFLIGLIVSALAFGIAIKFFGPHLH